MFDAFDIARIRKMNQRVRSLFVGRRHRHPQQNPEDVVFGAFPISLTDQHQNVKPGLHFDSLRGRVRVAGAIEPGEIEDPPELIFLRQPGKWPWGPLGQTALLAADVAPGATEFYLTTRTSLAYVAPAGVIPFYIGKTGSAAGQAISYTDHSAFRATLCGSHPIGSTALLFAAASFTFPSAGLGPIGGEMLEWTGKDVFLNTTVAVAAKAGDSTLALTSVAGLPASGVVVAIGAGSFEQNVTYTNIVGNVLQGCTGIRRNLAIGAVVKVERLTGVTHIDYVDTPIIADTDLGADRLRLLSTGMYQDEWDALPASGSARVGLWHDTTILDITWTGKDDDAGELTGVTGLTSAVPYMSALTYVNRTAGPTQAVHGNTAVLEIARVVGASGFVVGATRGAFAESVPRSKSATPKQTTTGIIHFDPFASGGGQQSRSGQIYNKTLEAVIDSKHYGGYTVFGTTTLGPNSFRRDDLILAPKGAGILGGGAKAWDEIIYPWQVAGPGARSVSQIMATELRLSDTNNGKWPTSGRIVLSVWNRVTNVQEDREFDYTGLNADNLGFTGVTYDGTGGYSLGDFYAEEAWIRLAQRVKYTAIAAHRQIVANVGESGEAGIGNVGPTVTNPEPGIKMGPLVCYRDATTGKLIIGNVPAITQTEMDAEAATRAAAIASEASARASADAGKLTAASNLSDLTNAVTARTNLGLGTAATHATGDYDAAGAAAAAQAASQPLDSDLTAIAALAPADDAVVQRKAGSWTSRTPVQLKTDLSLTKGDVGLANVNNTADSAKTIAGDVTGTLAAAAVEKVRGKNVPTPGAGQDQMAFVYDHATGAMVWTDIAKQSELDTEVTARAAADTAHAALLTGVHGQVFQVLTSDIGPISSDTSAHDITGLGLAIGASATERWLVKWWLALNAANVNMDARLTLTVPTGCTVRWGATSGGASSGNSATAGWSGTGVANTPALLTTAATSVSMGLGGGVNGIPIIALVLGGGTAGTVQLQYGQSTSDAGNLSVLAGSVMEAQKVVA